MYCIHKNKHREVAKMRRQKNDTNELTGENGRKRIEQNGRNKSTKYRVQSNGYKDT